jgi:hypothetical protein
VHSIQTPEKSSSVNSQGDDCNALGAWIASLDEPAHAVYEFGFCGFTHGRFFEEKDIPCKIVAISKLAKPSGDKVKTDRRNAAFLARHAILWLSWAKSLRMPSAAYDRILSAKAIFIARTGNEHIHKSLIESAWCYTT